MTGRRPSPRRRAKEAAFRATLGRTGGLYTVDVPRQVSRALDASGMTRVVFAVDGSSLRKTTLTPRAGGGHRLPIHGEVRREAGVVEGDRIHIELSLDADPTVVTLPPDLADALDEAGVLETFRTMGPAMQRELVAYVERAKRDLTREKYVARVVERASEVREKRLDRAARKSVGRVS